MTRKFYKIIVFVILFITMNFTQVLAYSDELFEFDLPQSYGQMIYKTMYLFPDSNNSDRGMAIYAYESAGLKKSVWDIDDDDLNKIIKNYSNDVNVLTTDKKAKLGKEKAIKMNMQLDDTYAETYILASNNYIYMVLLTGNTLDDLNNPDYKMIKDSFNIKDSSTDPKLIYFGIFLVIGGIWLFKIYRKNKNNMPTNYYNNIDYKNMTEDDLKM